jgi:hypothetical protein
LPRSVSPPQSRTRQPHRRHKRLKTATSARDRLGNLRRKGEDEYTRCFTQNAPKQASFAEATRQAQQLLSTALDRR